MSIVSTSLGHLHSVKNKSQKSRNEASTLIVGYVRKDDMVNPVAFTINELSRALRRAERNLEDLPALEVDDEKEELELPGSEEKSSKPVLAVRVWRFLNKRLF